MQRQSSHKVYLNTISNGESLEPLCDTVNRGLTLVRLRIAVTDVITLIMNKFVRAQIE